MDKKYVIIGASAAGIACANTLRRLDEQANITVISAEFENPYNKCLLADYASGDKKASDICILTAENADVRTLNISLGVRVEAIDRSLKVVMCDNGTTVCYDKLLIATGSHAIIPPISGMQSCQGVFTFHTIRDVHNILHWVNTHKSRRAVVIGAGLSGLEAADSLSQQGVSVMVIEGQDAPLKRHLDKESAAFIVQAMKESNVAFLGNTYVTACEKKDGRVSAVVTLDGKRIDADIVIIAAGVSPNTSIAREAGLEMHSLGGIATNSLMQTSDSEIWAAGDVAVIPDARTNEPILSTTWPDAMQQGAVAAHAMLKRPFRSYAGSIATLSSSFFGKKVTVAGSVVAPCTTWNLTRDESPLYYRLVVQDKSGRVQGFVLIGQAVGIAPLRRSLVAGTPLESEFC